MDNTILDYHIDHITYGKITYLPLLAYFQGMSLVDSWPYFYAFFDIA